MGLVDFSLGDIGGVFTSIRESITGEKIKDPAEMARVQLQLEQLIQASRDGQIAINKIEAAHSSIFVAGARPFILWTCGLSIFYTFLLQPMIQYFTLLAGIDVQPPIIDTNTLMSLTLSLLGMSGLRTYEKMKGVAREK